jgi:hypothetical protein
VPQGGGSSSKEGVVETRDKDKCQKKEVDLPSGYTDKEKGFCKKRKGLLLFEFCSRISEGGDKLLVIYYCLSVYPQGGEERGRETWRRA